MKLLWAALLGAVALGLTGCGSAVEAGATTSTASPTQVADPDLTACESFAKTMDPTLAMVTSIVEDPTGASLDATNVKSLASKLHETTNEASPRMQGLLEPYSAVIFTLDDIFAGKVSPNQNLDTGAYRDSVTPILSYCANDVGFRVHK